ncbi:MAG TPA: hypothetical protein VGR11_08400, partial [Solirubrobacteraceae bacterium]|nr:hypothetical protein [Solirubrobacteraceae bacterium]
MGHTEAPAWWADVQHLRDVYERTDEARRRAELADVGDRRAAREPRPGDEVGEHRAHDAGRAAPVARRGPHPRGTAIPARRTVEIRGRTVPAPS